MYEAVYGRILGGKVVRHKCDNPPCIRVAHLELGTQSENIKDAWRRGRMGRGGRVTERLRHEACLEILKQHYRRNDRIALARLERVHKEHKEERAEWRRSMAALRKVEAARRRKLREAMMSRCVNAWEAGRREGARRQREVCWGGCPHEEARPSVPPAAVRRGQPRSVPIRDPSGRFDGAGEASIRAGVMADVRRSNAESARRCALSGVVDGSQPSGDGCA